MHDNHHARVYFNVYLDSKGVLHISPRDGVERMALKYHAGEVAEHGMEKMVVIDTEIPIPLGSSDPKY